MQRGSDVNRSASASRPNAFGVGLGRWRAARRESQLSLACLAGVSQRHLSFIESGRSRPSREMVVRLCESLDIPFRARNELLAAAGFAPLYSERPLGDGPELAAVRSALDLILAHHEPYPAFVLDRAWRVVMSNAAGERLVGACVDAATLARLSEAGALNFMRLMFEPVQMRPRIRNWHEVEARLVARLRREAGADPTSPSAQLLEGLAPSGQITPPGNPEVLTPTVPVELALDHATLRLFNAITTFGTPQDITVQELRIELSFPADAASRALLAELAAGASRRRLPASPD
jgi:transcriptional regulator with XRE-family HTH domain